MIRKARETDLTAVAAIYDKILTREEAGQASTGWARGVYPTLQTAKDALAADILFVCEEDGHIAAAAKIDQTQVPVYADCTWAYAAPDSQVMVIHTLVVDPDLPRRGYGRQFVSFYETYAAEHGCTVLRMDTNEKNTAARALYQKLGYREAGIVSCEFNGIAGVRLVCLEKKLSL